MNAPMLFMASQVQNIVRFLVTLVVFVLVLAVTYGTTRWIGKYQKNYQTGRNIKYIEGFRLSGNKYIQIVQIGKEYIAMAVCKDTVTFLTKIREEDIEPETQGETDIQPSFRAILARLKEAKTDSKDEGNNEKKEL